MNSELCLGHKRQQFGFHIVLTLLMLASIFTGCAASRVVQNPVQSKLQDSYNYWKGTPYRIGGMTQSGVDCSAFVMIVMRDQFGIRLPRTTEDQLRFGKRVRMNRLRVGDLVFFRTGRKTLHVGIMVDNIQFMHASTSQGVMISSLREDYWRRRFIRGNRVI
jgi:cell wall-associated NlpC family hydrolase